MFYYGAHYSTYKGILHSLKKIRKAGGNFVQVFVSNPQGIGMKKRSPEEIKKIREYLKKHKMKLVIHAPYIFNFSRKFDPKSWWVRGIIRELELASKLGAIGSIIHCGKRKELTEKEALDNMFISMKYIVDNTPDDVELILETAAGQGTEVLYKLEDLAKFYKRFSRKYKERIGLCIDTCHIFSAGYNISTKKEMIRYFKQFDKLIGLRFVTLIQLNDSQVPLGARVDRHAKIGKGHIGLEGLIYVIKFAKKNKIPLILETPNEAYKTEIPLISSI